ncbi:hypothetical protein L914_03196, partial [Phytophthora nicotianae]
MCTDLDVFFGWMGGFDVQNDKLSPTRMEKKMIRLVSFINGHWSVRDGLWCLRQPYLQTILRTVGVYVRANRTRYGNQDRATYIANAYKAIWSGIGILNCYPHLSRKAYEKSGLLRDPTFYGNHVDKNIHELELARSPQQFLALAEKCTKFWITKHDKEYASWFTNQYLGERWGHVFARWQLLGVLPSQNPIESHHQALKTVCVPSKHVATSVVCNDTLPSVLYLDCDKP